MSTLGAAMLLAAVLLGTIGQLALKSALTPNEPRWLGKRAGFVLWLGCYALTTGLWIAALRITPLSQAFPILGLQFALIPIAAARLFGERIAPAQTVGIVLIVLGVALVGQG